MIHLKTRHAQLLGYLVRVVQRRLLNNRNLTVAVYSGGAAGVRSQCSSLRGPIQRHRLDRLIVEGSEKRWLRRHARELGASPDDNDRSLALLENCLMGYEFEQNNAGTVVRPFREFREHRSKFAHAAVKAAIPSGTRNQTTACHDGDSPAAPCARRAPRRVRAWP